MARGRQRHDWDQTALIAVILAESNRDPKKRRDPFEMSDFHPLMDRQADDGDDREHQAAEARRIMKGMA